RAALARDNREPLMDGRLVLMSPYDPAAGFNVGHAMQRNKIIYALADAALVVTSDFQKGGTWTGAMEQLERMRFVPLFVRNGANAGKGNAALQHHGAIPWPNPQNRQELDAALISAAEAVTAEPTQNDLPLTLREPEAAYEAEPVTAPEVSPQNKGPIEPVALDTERSPADELLATVCAVLTRELGTGRSEEEVAVLLNVTKPQAKAWLTRLVADGRLEKVKKSKPTLYRALKESDRLL
ncbi:MAG: DNA-processing protein DprA, partial [Lacunisphaera sp.]